MEDLQVILISLGTLFCIYLGPWLVSSIYTFIKNGIKYEKDIASLRLEIRELKNNREINNLNKELSRLKKNVNESFHKTAHLEKQIHDRDIIIHDRIIQYNDLKSKADEWEQRIIELEKRDLDQNAIIKDKTNKYDELHHNFEEKFNVLHRALSNEKKQKELFAYYLLMFDVDGKLLDSIPSLKKEYTDLNFNLRTYDLPSMDEIKQEFQQNKKMFYPGVVELLCKFEEKYDDIRIEALCGRAEKAAEKVREVKIEKKRLLKKCETLEYQLRVLENLFPWLEEFKTIDIDDAIEYAKGSSSDEDYEATLRNWLSPEEYTKLSRTEKLQLALDRYKKRNKTDWEAGIEYERYVGYIYEKDGYAVKYTGATDGLSDMGRDVIASKDSETLVIQCKRWAKSKTIHEKHIFQIFGTAFVLTVQNPNKTYRPVFYTTTKLSDLAMACADQLGVIVYEEFPMGDYPLIKCNLGHDEFGRKEKIYHLPFDQQYDKIKIEPEKGEFYAMTVEEAESKGFRKAMKHYVS